MSSKHPLSDEDKAAFRDAIEGRSSWDDDKDKPLSQGKSPEEIRGKWISLDYISESDWVDGEALILFSRSGVSGKQLKQLASGQVNIDQKLDFHGYNTDDLYEALGPAIHEARQSGTRLLLLVHGKGRLNSQPPAILKNYINQSLRQNTDVLAFHTAKPAHGGAGAIYVLLRGNHV